MASDALRTFIAVEPDRPVKMWLQGWLRALREHHPEMRWVRPENLHITLKFLGDVGREDISGITGTCDRVARETAPCNLQIGPPGIFGSRRSPRTFWIGFLPGPGIDRLKEAQRRLEEALVEEGFPAGDRSWSPHLTLGRNPRRRQADGWDDLLPPWRGEGTPGFQVESLSLFSSELAPGGPIYSLLSRSPFTGGSPPSDNPEKEDQP